MIAEQKLQKIEKLILKLKSIAEIETTCPFLEAVPNKTVKLYSNKILTIINE